ncbi:MAG: ATP-binding protein [Nitrospira sp.]|nr:hypothetical protein [Candidatus Manganitrophaceae bacterium]HIL35085.1 hypothetical protein [Candidatus Manganitrophaceae bacterium]
MIHNGTLAIKTGIEPFSTTKEIGRGTGLGLTSAYGTIKKHGGWIGLETAQDKGTTSLIYLPRTKDPVVTKVTSESGKPPATETETIMIVDDDEPIRELSKVILETQIYGTTC